LYRRAQKVDVNNLELAAGGAPLSGAETLAQVEDLLEGLQKVDPRLRMVVELRVFEGRTADEMAELMGCSPRTVHKYWSFAKRWLASELGDSSDLSR